MIATHHLLTSVLGILYRMALLLFCGAVRKVILQGRKECRHLKPVFLPVKLELILSDFSITCFLLRFFFV